MNGTLGEKIKSLRLKLGKSQEEFGDMLTPPAKKNSVSQWESGKNKPNKRQLKEIAELGNITVHELVEFIVCSNNWNGYRSGLDILVIIRRN